MDSEEPKVWTPDDSDEVATQFEKQLAQLREAQKHASNEVDDRLFWAIFHLEIAIAHLKGESQISDPTLPR